MKEKKKKSSHRYLIVKLKNTKNKNSLRRRKISIFFKAGFLTETMKPEENGLMF